LIAAVAKTRGHSACATTLPGSKLRIPAQPIQLVDAFVTLVGRHRPPPVCALRFQLCQHRGNVVAERSILLALGHREICKATHGSEHRYREEDPDHVPISVVGRFFQNHPKLF
jgi:hypothetical protein